VNTQTLTYVAIGIIAFIVIRRLLGAGRVASSIICFKKGQELERIEGYRSDLYHQDFIDNELLGPAVTAASHAG
jgi:hypothetical protein